jgi:hypothetical protein
VTAALDELPLEGLVDGGMGRDGIVGEATRCAIEGLGVGDHLGGVVEVGGLVDDMHSIADSDAIGRRPGAVRRFPAPPVATDLLN